MAQAPSGMSEVSIRRRGRDRGIVERRPPRMFAFAARVGVSLPRRRRRCVDVSPCFPTVPITLHVPGAYLPRRRASLLAPRS